MCIIFKTFEFSNLVVPLIRIDGEQLESPVIINAVLLRKHEYETPQIADQPRVNAVITFVRRHEYFGHRGNQALQTESLQVLQKDILINIEYL